jgi:hypothetical protein
MWIHDYSCGYGTQIKIYMNQILENHTGHYNLINMGYKLVIKLLFFLHFKS